MRLLKSALCVLFAVTLAAFIFSEYRTRSSGINDGPVITIDDSVPEISVNDPSSRLLEGVWASDAQDGDLTHELEIASISRLLSDNSAEVTYIVFDSNDNMATATRRFRYTDYSRPVISLNSPLIFQSESTSGLINHFSATDVIDGDISDRVRISSLIPTSDSSIYYVSVLVSNSMGDSAKLKLPVIITSDASAPTVSLSSYLEYVSIGEDFDPASFVASVTYGGEALPADRVSISGEVDTSVAGTYYIFYECTQNEHVGRAALTVSVR